MAWIKQASHYPLPTKTSRPRGWRKKKNRCQAEKGGGKQGRVESDINWTAWLAHQIVQVQETKIDRDVIVQLSSSSPAASSKRSSTDSFSKPNFAKLLVLPLQLCHMPDTRSALQLATLHASSHRATSCMVPLLSYAMAGISCFSGSGAK